MFLALAPHLIPTALHDLYATITTGGYATPPPSPTHPQSPLSLPQNTLPPSPTSPRRGSFHQRNLVTTLPETPHTLNTLPDPAESQLLVNMLIHLPHLAHNISVPSTRVVDLFMAMMNVHGVEERRIEPLLIWLSHTEAFSQVTWSTYDMHTVQDILQWEQRIQAMDRVGMPELKRMGWLSVVYAKYGARCVLRVLHRGYSPCVFYMEDVVLGVLCQDTAVLMWMYEHGTRAFGIQDEVVVMRWLSETGRVWALERFVGVVRCVDHREICEWIACGLTLAEVNMVLPFW